MQDNNRFLEYLLRFIFPCTIDQFRHIIFELCMGITLESIYGPIRKIIISEIHSILESEVSSP